jgi:RNA-binding protein
MMKKTLKDLRRMGGEIKATIHVGKAGITENLVEELRKQIKDKQVVKVKVLPSADITREVVAAQLSDLSSTHLLEVRGNTVLFCDRKLLR